MFVFVAIVQCILSSSTSSTGNVIYVDQSAAGPLHDGSSWCGAFVDLQDALAISVAGDDIHVANGSYLPDQGTGDRTASFQLIDGVGLYGGYAGCGAVDPNARDVTLFESVLSGDLIGDDVLFTNEPDCINAAGVWYGVLCNRIGNNYENAYHVVVSTDNNETAILDGFTVSDGNANAPGQGATPASRDQGSGINIYFGNPTLRNCIFENNRAGNHGAVNDHGGATLLNCEIRGNFANRWGGGLHNHANIQTSARDCLFYANATAGTAGGGGGMFVKGQPTLINCIFSDNVSATNGGAMYNDAGAVPTLIDCTFTENSASLGGALYNTDGGSPIMTNCSITDNTATEFGGGMYNILESHGVLTNCTFRANTAQSGGAIYLRLDSDPTLEGCTIIEN
ncbi:MAG: right-handed parallel beta-helix repeat-containing protein, partial [Planctomycetes bacterium]|nr:right-handed parallel beta-helix repeat-containing protein [Planctomycetota bacterium]